MNYDVLEFNSKILNQFEKDGKKFIILSETHFYPDGVGGQLSDRGYIGNAKVLNVFEDDNGNILHQVDHFEETIPVHCKIDAERRKDIEREHTAQHIISRALEVLYGIETVSFHMGEELSTIDINRVELKDDELENIELLSNKIVLSGRAVKKYYIDREQAYKIDIRKASEIKGPIRIVEVDGFDITMCGGTHVNVTNEIGIIKIFKKEKVKKDYLRLYFASGLRALKIIQKKVKILGNLSKLFTTSEQELGNSIQKLMEENKNLSKKIKTIEEILINELSTKFNEGDVIKENIENISKKSFEKLAVSLKKKGVKGYLKLIDEFNSTFAFLSDVEIEKNYRSYTIEGVKFVTIPKDEELVFESSLAYKLII